MCPDSMDATLAQSKKDYDIIQFDHLVSSGVATYSPPRLNISTQNLLGTFCLCTCSIASSWSRHAAAVDVSLIGGLGARVTTGSSTSGSSSSPMEERR